VGEGEKLVRTLFAVARVKQPSVIFIDEIDSLLTQRTDGEQEGTRRIKTEFLVQFDGCGTNNEDRILMIGATNRYFMLNRPQEIDEAARRRFRKKLYIPLPDYDGRKSMLVTMLGQQKHDLTEANLEEIVKKTEGYSGSDMDGLIRESSLGPIRDIMDISSIKAEDVRGISFHDFFEALDQVKASVSERDLDLYKRFELEFGSMG
jgi:SpoVK/Ycf46/Vps4 family AAA+-type ATPase